MYLAVRFQIFAFGVVRHHRFALDQNIGETMILHHRERFDAVGVNRHQPAHSGTMVAATTEATIDRICVNLWVRPRNVAVPTVAGWGARPFRSDA